MKNWKLPTLFKTPFGVVFILSLSIMLVELLIMSVIHAPPIAKHLSTVHRTLIDSILLTLIVLPVLYFLVFKRLKSDELLRQINTSTQEAIVIVNQEGCITGWNPAAQRYFQYTQEEVIGKPLHPLLAPAHYHADALRGFANFQKTGKGPLVGSLIEVTAIRKDGSEFPVELSLTALKAKGGWQAIGVMRDISVRNRAKDALRASEAKFSTIFESNPAMIAIGTTEGVIVEANQSYANFLGYTRQEMTGKSLADLGAIGEDELQRLLTLGRNAGDSLRNVEMTLRTRGGNPVDVLLSAEYVALDGMPYRLATLQDITARKLAEKAVRASEAEFRTLAEAMPQIVWITRPDGWNIYFNQQWMDYTGLTLEESYGHGWNKPFHPDDQQRAWDAWQLAVAGRGIYSIESRLRHADGVYRWWLIRGVPVKDANGEILKWFGTCTDIHDLKMAELAIANTNAELRESERRFSDLLGNVELLSMMLDREARITYCNEYLLRLTGWKREEIIGRNWFDVFAPTELNELKTAFFDKLLANLPEAHHHENEILTSSGGRLLIHWDNSVLRSAKGDVIGTASIGEDITERKRLELEREQYFKFFKLSINPMCIADPFGCFTQVNPALVKLTGYSESELIAKPFLNFVLPEDRQKTEKEMKLQMEQRPTLNFENHYLRKDGSVIDLSWTGYYDKHDGITYATATDTTERKRTEASLLKLSQAVEQSPSAIAITDLKANIEYVNEGFINSSGYSRAELIGSNPRMLHSGKTPRASHADMWAHLLRGDIWKGEFTNRRKDGREYIESVLMSPVRQADGRVTHYLTVKEDITQLKQAQQALQASRENLHRLLNSMAEGAYGLDTHGNCTFVNHAFLKLLGYQHENEVLGKHIHELIHHSHADGSSYPADECKIYRAFRNNQLINVSDEMFWRKDGVAVPVEYWSHPIVSDGVTIGAIVTFIDITERMNAIAAMREKELLLSESQRIAHIGSWHLELTGQVTWSDEAYRIYGVSPDTFTPTVESLLHLIHPADRVSMQEWISSCTAGNKPGELEFRICPPDGTERVISGYGELQYDALNRPSHLIGIVHDITARKQTEAKLAEQLEELRRWHEVTSGREGRILELKHEVNEMLGQTGQPIRYPSAEAQDQIKE